MICPNCKSENREDYKFCAYCGTPRPAAQAQAAPTAAPPRQPEPVYEAQPPALENLQAAEAAPEVKPRRKKNCLVISLISLLVLLCLAVVALIGIALVKPEWLPFELPFMSSSNNLIIGYPTASGETDLYLLRQGRAADQGLLLAEDVLEASSAMFYQPENAPLKLAGIPYPFGSFVPEQNYLLYWYSDAEGKITLQRLELNAEEPVTLWQDNASSLTGYVLANPQDLFLRAAEDNQLGCYLSMAGAEASEVLRGSSCGLSGDFSTAFASQMTDSQTTFRVFNLADNTEFTPLDEQENVGTLALSGDGARLAYTDLEGQPRVSMLNSQNASAMATGPEAYAVIDLGFAARGRIGYFIAENQDGNLELYLLSDSGASLVRSGLSMAAALDLDGSHLVYMAGEYEGERALYVRDVSAGSDVEVLRGNELRFAVANPLNRIFISVTQETETTVYSANTDGSGLVSLYTCEACQMDRVTYVPGQPYVYIELTGEQGISLLAAHSEQAAQFLVADNWASVALLDTSADGLQLLYAGADSANADSSLYLARLDAQQTTILDDDADGIANALFNEKGDAVVYTALTGNNPDDVEIRSIQIDLAEPGEVLYPDAFLVAAQWDTLQPLLTTYSPSLVQSTSYCPGSDRLGSGATVEGNFDSDPTVCYSYRGRMDEEVTFWTSTTADIDLALTLYDRQGNQLAYDDAGFNSTDPRLITKLPADGIYYLEVSVWGETPGSFSLSSTAGSSYCPGVPAVTLGEEQNGEMDDAGQQFFSFSGSANQELTFWVESSELDPMLTLYDSEGIMLGNDDNNRDGIDPLLSATLPEDGSYCLEVNTFGFETGPYTLSMVEGSVFCPGADSLNLDQTVSSPIGDGRRVCYEVELTYGTTYNLAVNSPTDTDTVMELYDSSGMLLVTDDDSGGNLNPELVYLSDLSGSYYVVVRGYSSSTSGEIELTFSEGYGFCENAQPIALGDVLTGYLSAGGEVCYSFTGSSGQIILVNVDAVADTTLTLYAEDATELLFDDDSGEGLNPQLWTALPNNATYFIDLRGYSSGEGNFTLTFETGPDMVNPFTNASLLPANQRVAGEISVNDAVNLTNFGYEGYGDMYYFDGSSGQTIQIDVFARELGSGMDPMLILFDESGITVLADNDDTDTSLDSQIVMTLTYTGRYYLMIADAYGDYGENGAYFYELQLSYP